MVTEKNNEISIIEVNSETDFVAKNREFVAFCKELSEINFISKGNLEKLEKYKMKNGLLVKDNLINFISKIGENNNKKSKFF